MTFDPKCQPVVTFGIQNIKQLNQINWTYICECGDVSRPIQDVSSGQLMILAVFKKIDLWPDVETFGIARLKGAQH